MTSLKSFNVTYDRDSDVLYISTPNRAATRGVEDQPGVVWRYGTDGDLLGITIVDFGHYWYSRREELASAISHKLDVPARQVQTLFEHVMSD